MRRAIVAVVLALAFSTAGYVRRGITARPVELVSIGSRDRTLHGKARRRARRDERAA